MSFTRPVSGIDARTVYIGLICTRDEWDTGFRVAIDTVNALIVEHELEARITPFILDDISLFTSTVRFFIERSDRFQQRAIIVGTSTSWLITADRICSAWRIPVFSMGATATSIIEQTSDFACTWMPLDRNIAMFFFMLHCMYGRTEAFVVYDFASTDLAEYVDSFLNDMQVQAAQFQMTLCFTTLESISTLPENATILLLAPNSALEAAGATRLRCLTPNSSIVLLTSINSGARAAWFGSGVVPLCAIPYALDYTNTTRTLVQAMGSSILGANPFFYALFDCAYSLAKFSLLTGKDLTVSNLVQNPVTLETDLEPAFSGVDSICAPIKSACYCKYSLCYVRSNLILDRVAYETRFDGGNPIFPDSLATLYQFSFTHNATTFVLDSNRLFRLRDSSSALLLEKFDTDQILSLSSDTFAPPVNGASELPLGVSFEFDANGVPSKLLDIQFFEGLLPVTEDMGKVVIEYTLP